ncbi:hypothetical protein AZE42_05780 [Rhizopogon vesiculosus]|uniref:AB hydrolase-1 domain-containing protein n=1 Tax=Rhizopogon vesiculosus TaxID=180088 RepID=A0A1J8PVX9_9AGAM|nr:hypothetical protein AZE42_05780 [Rhizopogon vesiculosus]
MGRSGERLGMTGSLFNIGEKPPSVKTEFQTSSLIQPSPLARSLNTASMNMSMSASQWGSPLASRRALLIHGITASSHTWESFAQLLVAKGFFVIAPNLLGHAGRRGSDYRLSTLAEDLQPYFVKDTYDVIIGHSLGGTVALSLLPFLPKEKETTVILVDPPLEIPVMRSDIDKHWILKELTAKTVEERMAENPAWSRVDCVLRTLAVSMCDHTTVESIFAHNKPWSHSGLFKNIPHNVKVTVLVADPTLSLVCHLDHIPRDIERLEAIGLTGVGHHIPSQRPDAIMDCQLEAAPPPVPLWRLSNALPQLRLSSKPLHLSPLARSLNTASVNMSMSASQWGSPLASRRALLIHGMTMSSHTWESFAQLLVGEGFFVIAPNLLGHAGRRGSDYRLSTLAEDLQPYFVKDTYDVIIGHSLGGAVALSLLPLLPEEKETTVILVDPPLEVTAEGSEMHKKRILKEFTSAKTVEEWMAENPALSRVDCVLRTLAVSMCDRTVVESIFAHNTPWSFSGLFKSIPHNVKITVLVADPKLSLVCHLDHIPHDIERLDARGLTGVGHHIQVECPGAILDVIPLPRAEV